MHSTLKAQIAAPSPKRHQSRAALLRRLQLLPRMRIVSNRQVPARAALTLALLAMLQCKAVLVSPAQTRTRCMTFS